MTDCLFCKIIAGEIPSAMVYEDENMVAFKDINPKAKTHLLIVPRKHIPTMMDLNAAEEDHVLVGNMMLAAQKIAKDKDLSGCKLQFNVGESGGQEVFHIHLHLLSHEG